ncbi:MAG: high-potential iron-sulfur protein [Hylemonella sp.]|uniref:high-potential iron-sulfur protein n=1 Tax=Hylemonella sp. TaxID=2066020 RepID=UPI0022C699A3|nr:high-potential iron-sulfur protein [Hylemonella sp.]MCZ8253834.1 high-potential iron-sulfur protein [Hylemonella sp.]
MSVHSKCQQPNRRVFMLQAVTVTGAVLVAREASAQPMVSESDAQAASLGYKADAAKVDKAKNPKFAANQNCANCALYQGKPGAASGPCGIFPGKQVAAKGWCTAWAKKA